MDHKPALLWLLALAVVALAYRILFIGTRRLALADYRVQTQHR